MVALLAFAAVFAVACGSDDAPVAVIVESIPAAEGFQRAGAEGFGFVDIPDYWSYHLADADVLQFADPSAENFIILQRFTDGDMGIEDLIQITASFMDEHGGEDITGGDANVNGIDARVVFATFPMDDTVMAAYIFESGGGTLHKIRVEGPYYDIGQTASFVLTSFSLSP